MTPSAERSAPDGSGDRRRLWWTLPNLICLLRLAAAPLLPVVAGGGRRDAVVALFLAMALSDWIDGKLAVLLDQRSVFGPRLDSIADAAMYAGLGLATLILDGDRMGGLWPWIGTATATYLLAGVRGVVELGPWPTYHTRLAKTSWLLVGLGSVILLLGGPAWPLAAALAVVTLGNLESVLITEALDRPRSDVSSIFAVRRESERGSRGDRPGERPRT